ncbi:DUF1456 family protein [Aliagarivorans marinus]|uniref:DUF1456 family protein n=1 Tax=Aliagarivorans marinus TaxID=561965 RepID=UPI00040B9EDF|nr:DUF1456 family protein [Aliagarivorans marinus]
MIHNDILRRLRYALKLNDRQIQQVFALVDYDIELPYLASIMKKEDEPGFQRCRDSVLSLFLDGLIIKNRGKQPGKEPVKLGPKERLSNNEVLRKIRIALTLRDDDIIAICAKEDFRISKGELSALFRRPDHRNYQECGDQLLRNFLNGLAKTRRGEKPAQTDGQAQSNAPSSKAKGDGKFKGPRKPGSGKSGNASRGGKFSGRKPDGEKPKSNKAKKGILVWKASDKA